MNANYKQWINWLISPLPKIFKEQEDYSPISEGAERIKKVAINLLIFGVVITSIWYGVKYLLTKKRKK
jgi:hypothetical protein